MDETGKEVAMRHTLDEISMLQILAAAESKTRPRADPRCPRCLPAIARIRRGHQVSGEQEAVPDVAGDDDDGLGHRAADPLDVPVRQSGTGIPTGRGSPGLLRIAGGLRVGRF
jgi:hypothetical protein